MAEDMPRNGTPRSFSDVLQDIIANIQEIVRYEVRLAKVEIREEAVAVKTPVILLAAGLTLGMFSMLFLLLTAFHALSMFVPNWEAALIVGISLGVIALGILNAAKHGLKRTHPILERTANTIKENAEWIPQRTK